MYITLTFQNSMMLLISFLEPFSFFLLSYFSIKAVMVAEMELFQSLQVKVLASGLLVLVWYSGLWFGFGVLCSSSWGLLLVF